MERQGDRVHATSFRYSDRTTWGQVLADGQNRLKEAGIAEYSLDAWFIFEQAFGMSRMQYLMRSVEKAEPDETALAVYKAGIERRAGREPLQHILGTQEFMGLEFSVNRYVLIPRQDTETLVETVLSAHKDRTATVLDMCTGSGCIAISLAKLGGYAHVEAADISVEALHVAEENAAALLEGRKMIPSGAESVDVSAGIVNPEMMRFRHSDMFSAFDPLKDQFDIIVSNPPYIPSDVIKELEPEVRDFEPRNALDGTADGLFFYKKLAEECGKFLKENGAVYFDIGHDQGEAVANLLFSHGFKDTKVIKDLAGKDRVVCGRWQTA